MQVDVKHWKRSAYQYDIIRGRSGFGAVVARTPGGREVAGSIPVTPTISWTLKRSRLGTSGASQGANTGSIPVAPTNQGGKIKKACFLYLTDADWKDFCKAKSLPRTTRKKKESLLSFFQAREDGRTFAKQKATMKKCIFWRLNASYKN